MPFLPYARLGAALALAACALPAAAQAPASYPERPVHIVVPFPPGGIVDNVTRNLGARLSAALGQTFIVENKAGAGGSIGAAHVAKAAPDGYTLLAAFDTHAVNPLLYKLSFDSDKDLAPVALIGTSPLILVVHPSVPARTVPELVALAKARPDALNYASTGAGSSNQLTAELFKATAGVEMNHVPYKGGAPAITDVLGGRVQVMFVSASSVLAHIKAGKMRALAVTTRERIPALPDVPSISQFYPDFEARSWIGLLAPAGTPAAIVSRLNTEVYRALRTPEMQTFFDAQAIQPGSGSPEQFGAFLRNETKKWGEIIKKQNIRVE
ncbi:tripartite tricarboxylate transporter substrate binding protein [Pigmentiphaga sp. H8]|uniref:tripartite tricarboxylate transporter substrate binding protein n=1 Tax=unclassified Pigmentiphaga TaxID=2626614 RepID=UPI000F5A1043|nr:tripartite tricarboxylate transporter substrate binding protein [Pigmentiphaga sp. H8]AZG06541.1 tripartite tricarboxylate transporter substrate binding protein [Pigmentiphaga sp. H8]